MKINPLDKQQLIKTNGTAPRSGVQAENFGRVLEKTLQSTPAAPRVTPARSMASPILNGIQPYVDVRQEVYHRLDRILGTFENYQVLLGDQRSSLKNISHIMDELKVEGQDLEAMLAKVGDEDPLKSILNETLVTVSKEIFQFESGAYVE